MDSCPACTTTGDGGMDGGPPHAACHIAISQEATSSRRQLSTFAGGLLLANLLLELSKCQGTSGQGKRCSRGR